MPRVLNREVIIVSGTVDSTDILISPVLNLGFKPTKVIIRTVSFYSYVTADTTIKAEKIIIIKSSLTGKYQPLCHFPLSLVYDITESNTSFNCTFNGQIDTEFKMTTQPQGNIDFVLFKVDGTKITAADAALAITLEFIEEL